MNCLTFDDLHFLESLRDDFERLTARTYDELFGTDTEKFIGANILIEGTVHRDMYDHAPGHTYFTTRHTEQLLSPGLMGQEQIRAFALAIFVDRACQYSCTEEIFDGLFCPLRIAVYDRYGRIIDLYENGSWFDEWIPESEWMQCTGQLNNLLKLASEEAGKDNFENSKRHREAANRLGRHLELSRLAASR